MAILRVLSIEFKIASALSHHLLLESSISARRRHQAWIVFADTVRSFSSVSWRSCFILCSNMSGRDGNALGWMRRVTLAQHFSSRRRTRSSLEPFSLAAIAASLEEEEDLCSKM